MDANEMQQILAMVMDDMEGWKRVATVFAVQAEEFMPILAPPFKRLLEGMNGHGREMKAANFQFYLDKGFSREEAMLLTVDAAVALNKLIEASTSGVKGKKK